MSLQPIIKWSGGKRAEIKSFEKYFPAEYSTYIEPFIGGGAVYFHLAPQAAVIADVHPDLISLYKSIKNGGSETIHNFMKEHPNDEKTYYEVRDDFEPTTDLERACKFYYERKTCFRGMLRYNKKGKFNIPFGRYKTVSYDDILDERYHKLLSRTDVLNGSFEEVFEKYNCRRDRHGTVARYRNNCRSYRSRAPSEIKRSEISFRLTRCWISAENAKRQ